MTLSIMVECSYAVSFMLTVVYAECRQLALYAECHYAKCRYAECHGADFMGRVTGATLALMEN
jgi:hypothetical protein